MVRVVLLASLLTGPVLAQAPAFQATTNRPARELLVAARVVLVVAPVDNTEPARVKVVEVIRGSGVAAGDVLDGARLAALMPAELGPDWLNLGQAVLIGDLPAQPGGAFVPLPTGIRLATRTGKVWQAHARREGAIRLIECPGVEWARLLGRLRADAAEVAAVEKLRQEPPGPGRSAALREWLARHPPARVAPLPVEPGEAVPADDLGEGGWGELETAPLRWILRTGDPAESWEALTLYARLHGGAVVGRDCHPFATPEGRELLLARATDERALLGDALRALQILAWPETFPTAPVPGLAFAVPLTEAEQGRLLERVQPLLAKADGRWKQAAARALVAILAGVEKPPAERRRAVVRALEEQFQAAKPGRTRDVLGATLYRLDPEGRPPLALLLDLGNRDLRLFFWLGVYPEGGVVKEVPRLVLEEVTAGKPGEKVEHPLPCPAPPDWEAGWDTRRPLFVEVPLARLKTGATYQLTVSGVVGPEAKAFATAPRTFQFLPPTNPGQPGAVPRIVVGEEP